MTDIPAHKVALTRQARTSAGAAIEAGLARDLSELARDLQAEPDADAVMRRIVTAAVDEIGGATDAAITLLHHGKLSSPAHTGERAARVGRAQVETGEGPCIDTSRKELTIRSDDLREDDRWPRFAKVAVDNGVLSMLSVQLFVEGDSMGALDIYSDVPHGFDGDAEDLGLLLAAHAAIALKGSRQQANFDVALDSRDLIGQAKGILMERHKIDAVLAFDLLVVSSRETRRKLRDIAGELVRTGELRVPGRPTSS